MVSTRSCSLSSVRVAITEDELTLDTGGVQGGSENAAANVTYLGAAQDNEKVPEVTLPDASGNRIARGALSYLFARALDGQADADSDGKPEEQMAFTVGPPTVRIYR